MRASETGRATVDDVVAHLTRELGSRVSSVIDVLDETRADASGHFSAGRPLAMVSAESVADVQAALRVATATRTPVVARGAGTGAAGAAIAGPGEIVLSTTRMDRILGGTTRRHAGGRGTGDPQRHAERSPRRARPLVGARPGEPRHFDRRRQHRHGGRRPVVRQVRQPCATRCSAWMSCWRMDG